MSSFRSSADSLSFVLYEGTGRVGEVELGTVEVVVAGEEEGDAEGAGHALFGVAVVAFAEGEGEVADGLG